MSDYIKFTPPMKHLEKQFVGRNKKLLKELRKQMKDQFVKTLEVTIAPKLQKMAETNFVKGSLFGTKWTPAFSSLKNNRWYVYKKKKNLYKEQRGGSDTRLSYTGAIEQGYYNRVDVSGSQKKGFDIDIEVGNEAAHFEDFERGTNPMGYKWSTLPDERKEVIRMIDDEIDDAFDVFANRIQSKMRGK